MGSQGELCRVNRTFICRTQKTPFNRSTLDRTFLCGRFADRILVAEHANLLHLLGGRHGLAAILQA